MSSDLKKQPNWVSFSLVRRKLHENIMLGSFSLTHRLIDTHSLDIVPDDQRLPPVESKIPMFILFLQWEKEGMKIWMLARFPARRRQLRLNVCLTKDILTVCSGCNPCWEDFDLSCLLHVHQGRDGKREDNDAYLYILGPWIHEAGNLIHVRTCLFVEERRERDKTLVTDKLNYRNTGMEWLGDGHPHAITIHFLTAIGMWTVLFLVGNHRTTGTRSNTYWLLTRRHDARGTGESETVAEEREKHH